MIGLGTAINVVAVLVGSAVGVALGHRLPRRTRDVVTDGLGLITLLVAALSAAAILDPSVSAGVGRAGILIVLASVLIGGIIGSLLQIEARLEGLGESLRARLAGPAVGAGEGGDEATAGSDAVAPGGGSAATAPGGAGDRPSSAGARDPGPAVDVEIEAALTDPEPAQPSTFVEGFVTASLVFCVGPLTILGAFSDGLGRGIDQLALKSVMDGFAAIAFAASLGWGVAASALVVAVYQGALTVLAWRLGTVLDETQISVLTACGGLLLVGIALRLLRLRAIPVGDLLPALVVAPILTGLVAGWV